MSRGDVKHILLGQEVRDKVLQGAAITYGVASAAYGPISGNVALEKSYGNVVISHDGITNVKEVILRDKVQDIGADLLKQASDRSADVSGDGSTATVLLGYHIMKKANQRIAAGYNPMGLRRGIDKASVWVKDEVTKLAKPVEDDKLAEVATISASDPELGKLVADTVIRVGGVGITIEEHDGLGVIQDVVEGLYFEKGWTMPHFVTDRETEEAIHEDVSIMVVEKRMSTAQDVVPLLKLIAKTPNKTVLIIGNITNKALDTCALNNIAPESQIKVCVVSPPVYGDQVLPFLEDVAAMTGGKLIPSNLPNDKVTEEYLGLASKIIVQKANTTIIGGKANTELVQQRVDTLKKQLLDPKYTAFQRERMEKRLSKLQGKLGMIRVGGASEVSRKELKLRVDDAVCATRAAREEGVVSGGATTLARLSLENGVDNLTDPAEQEGFRVVLESLPELFKQLIENAGDDPGYRLKQMLRSRGSYGFNVKQMTDEPIDLDEAGILDPAKVIKSIVENACDAAGIAITLNAAVTIDRDYQLEQVAMTKANIL